MKAFLLSSFLMLTTAFQVSAQDPTAPIGSRQRGTATYYGDMYQGRKTASGEIFTNDSMTCSHRTLPFNTMLHITNMSKGNTLTVRVNDRGPRPNSSEIYLTQAAALKLGLTRGQHTPVMLYVIGRDGKVLTEEEKPMHYETEIARTGEELHEKNRDLSDVSSGDNSYNRTRPSSPATGTRSVNTKQLPPSNLIERDMNANTAVVKTYDMEGNETSPAGYGVQLFSVAEMKMAQEICQNLITDGFDTPLYVQQGWVKGKKVYRVIAGDIEQAAARELYSRLKQKGQKGFIQKHAL
jgi:rare lipoprotein A